MPAEWSTHTRCLETVEALFIDGANGVCTSPRDHAGEPLPRATTLWNCLGLALPLVAVLLARLTRSSRSRPVAAWALALALPVSALVGLRALAFLRADRPAALASTARAMRTTLSQLDAFSAKNGRCVRASNDCLVCDALERFVNAPDCDGITKRYQLRALGAPCTERDGALACDEPPAR